MTTVFTPRQRYESWVARYLGLFLAALPAFFIGWTIAEYVAVAETTPTATYLVSGLVAGLVSALVFMRRIENMIRKHAFEMATVETDVGLSFREDAQNTVSDDAENALAEALTEELERE
jgi:hypothetical protein